MSALRRDMVAGVGGTPLAVHRYGSGRPLMLLHGLFSSAEMNWIKWGHHERIAEKGYELFMPDFRVHGESASPREPEAFPRNVLVDDVALLVGHYGLTDYDLGGFSLGARTTLHAVASGACDPARIVIGGMGTAGLGEWEKRAAFFRRVIDEFDTIAPGDPAYFSKMFLKSQGVDRVAARLLLATMPDLDLTMLARVTVPALVVCGAEDRDNGSAPELAALLPDATYAEVPGNHMSSCTRPELGQAIADWLGPMA